jgi:hypothetical protein
VIGRFFAPCRRDWGVVNTRRHRPPRGACRSIVTKKPERWAREEGGRLGMNLPPPVTSRAPLNHWPTMASCNCGAENDVVEFRAFRVGVVPKFPQAWCARAPRNATQSATICNLTISAPIEPLRTLYLARFLTIFFPITVDIRTFLKAFSGRIGFVPPLDV